MALHTLSIAQESSDQASLANTQDSAVLPRPIKQEVNSAVGHTAAYTKALRGSSPSSSSGEELFPVAVVRKAKVVRIKKQKAAKDEYEPNSLEEYWLRKEEIEARNFRRRKNTDEKAQTCEKPSEKGSTPPREKANDVQVSVSGDEAAMLPTVRSEPIITSRVAAKGGEAIAVRKKHGSGDHFQLRGTQAFPEDSPQATYQPAEARPSYTLTSPRCKTKKRAKRRAPIPVMLALNTPSDLAGVYMTQKKLPSKPKTAAVRLRFGSQE